MAWPGHVWPLLPPGWAAACCQTRRDEMHTRCMPAIWRPITPKGAPPRACCASLGMPGSDPICSWQHAVAQLAAAAAAAAAHLRHSQPAPAPLASGVEHPEAMSCPTGRSTSNRPPPGSASFWRLGQSGTCRHRASAMLMGRADTPKSEAAAPQPDDHRLSTPVKSTGEVPREPLWALRCRWENVFWRCGLRGHVTSPPAKAAKTLSAS